MMSRRNHKPQPKLRRLKSGKVMRNHRIMDYSDLTEAEVEQLELQELATGSAEEQLDQDQIVMELHRIDGKYASIEMELEKTSSQLLTGDKVGHMKLTLGVLDRRRNLLRGMLDKKLPDRKATEFSGALDFGGASAEAIPDEVLLAAIAGQLDDKQLEMLKLLFEPHVGGEQ